MSRLVLPIAARVQRNGWPALWLPLFLLWPVLLAAFCLALPLCLLLALPASRHAALSALVTSYELLCALHGTEIQIDASRDEAWRIALY